MRIRNFLFNSLPYAFVFISSLYRPRDSDLGWHLRYGEYFFRTGCILRENIHSTEMAGFSWTNPSYLTDILTFFIYSNGGFLGLTLAAALIITLTFWVFSKAFSLDLFQKAFIFPVLITLESSVSEASFRGQLISVLFLGLLFLLLEKCPDKLRSYLLPLLFMIWANTHGQFILGLGVLTLYTGFKILEGAVTGRFRDFLKNFIISIKNHKNLLIALCLSVLGGAINPFGFAIYEVDLSHFNSPQLAYILEYMPFEDLSHDWWKQTAFGTMLFFGLFYLISTRKIKKNIVFVGIMLVLYLLSLFVRRYAWSMYYLGIPLLKSVANILRLGSEKNTNLVVVGLFIFYISCSIYLKLPFSQFTSMSWQKYCSDFNYCSEGAIEYVAQNHLEENMISMYNWGGYIIWMHPEIKPSIDGRMAAWKDPKTGYSPLTDYYAYEQNIKDINNSKYDVVLMGNDRKIYKHLDELTKEGKWEKKYEDHYGGVFVRSHRRQSQPKI